MQASASRLCTTESSLLSNSREIHLPRTSCGIIGRGCRKITDCLSLHSGRVFLSDAVTILYRPITQILYLQVYDYISDFYRDLFRNSSVTLYSCTLCHFISHSSLDVIPVSHDKQQYVPFTFTSNHFTDNFTDFYITMSCQLYCHFYIYITLKMYKKCCVDFIYNAIANFVYLG